MLIYCYIKLYNQNYFSFSDFRVHNYIHSCIIHIVGAVSKPSENLFHRIILIIQVRFENCRSLIRVIIIFKNFQTEISAYLFPAVLKQINKILVPVGYGSPSALFHLKRQYKQITIAACKSIISGRPIIKRLWRVL